MRQQYEVCSEEMYKTSTNRSCSGESNHNNVVNMECDEGDFFCSNCTGKLMCNSCSQIEIKKGSVEIFAHYIRKVDCATGSTVIINAYYVEYVSCTCNVVLNAYHVEKIACGRRCNATLRIQEGASLHTFTCNLTKYCHHTFQEFCENIGFEMSTVAATLATTTIQTTTEYETTGSYLIL